MAIDPVNNYTKAVQAYNQTLKSGTVPNSLPDQDGPKPAGGGFSGMVSNYLNEAQRIGEISEQMTMKGLQNQADLADVVNAVNEADLTLQTVVTVRDKVLEAYKEILRMPM
ncbi:MAG: flagellar hook-basal body complex protein FliE [Alphaproteobacteria bacterium]|nr:flagellar hook-basal body complex protein FliE [Alphaproteobacteria bacterium]MBF0251302.1 flagellar hook-basal body complex protein FliE [Alphaproteobacteria bacterium]